MGNNVFGYNIGSAFTSLVVGTESNLHLNIKSMKKLNDATLAQIKTLKNLVDCVQRPENSQDRGAIEAAVTEAQRIYQELGFEFPYIDLDHRTPHDNNVLITNVQEVIHHLFGDININNNSIKFASDNTHAMIKTSQQSLEDWNRHIDQLIEHQQSH